MKSLITMCVAACLASAAPAFASDAEATRPTAEELEKANPLKPLPKVPLGVMRTFEQLPETQRPTPETVRLGRWLFFEKRLSNDNTISCATCHRPRYAFSEPTAVSTGIGGQKGGRKAPTFLNAAWAIFPHMFWDGRAPSLEEQAKGPMTNPIEMGMSSHDVVVKRLRAIDGYRPYFKEAFGDGHIDIDRVAKAIADYERTRMSGNSPWDKWQANLSAHDKQVIENLTNPDPFGPAGPTEFKDGKYLTAKAKKGHVLFFGKAGCQQCHRGPNLTDTKFHNLGVGWDPKKEEFKDKGRFVVTEKPEDMGAFKTPTVREASLRPPYMHDGSVATLREVVELYNKGGEKNPYLSPKVKPLNLTEDEIDALVAFMQALEGEGYMDTEPEVFPQ